MRSYAPILALALLCVSCFTGDTTKHLLCNSDASCGPGQRCLDDPDSGKKFCDGPPPMATTSDGTTGSATTEATTQTGTPTSTDASTGTSTSSNGSVTGAPTTTDTGTSTMQTTGSTESTGSSTG